MVTETKAQLKELNDSLSRANELLNKRIESLDNALQARVSLSNSLADYLKLVNEQLHATIASIEQVLVSHETLSKQPIKKL